MHKISSLIFFKKEMIFGILLSHKAFLFKQYRDILILLRRFKSLGYSHAGVLQLSFKPQRHHRRFDYGGGQFNPPDGLNAPAEIHGQSKYQTGKQHIIQYSAHQAGVGFSQALKDCVHNHDASNHDKSQGKYF